MEVKGSGTNSHVVFTAAAGEANRVTVTLSSQRLLVRDTGAPVTAGSGCTVLRGNSVRCTRPTTYEIVAGDGDDVISAPTLGGGGRLDGGNGHDVITGAGTLEGGFGNDVLQGGLGNDRLFGGPGSDTLRGSRGNDSLDGDGAPGGPDIAADGDVLDGGQGLDVVSYAARTTAVYVNLVTAASGNSSETDGLVAIENAEGGRAADVLTGNDGPNALYGGDGDDLLSGAGGDDTLVDGKGRDRLDGEDGNDRLYTTDRGDQASGGRGDDRLEAVAPARLDGGEGNDTFDLDGDQRTFVCGAGDDRVFMKLTGQRLDGCELAVFAPLSIGVRPLLRGTRLELPVMAHPRGTTNITGVDGGIELVLRRTGRKPLRLGRPTFHFNAGLQGTASLSLTRAQRRALRAHPLLELRLRTTPRGGKRLTARWLVRL